MRVCRLFLLLSCLVLALGVAGCGSDDQSGLPAGAELVPADAVLFAAVNTDFETGQWETAGELLNKFPDGDKLRSMIFDGLSAEGIDLDADVKPAVGPQVNAVWLDAADQESFVGLTQPKDADKLRALLEKSGDEYFFREVEGWTAFATDEKYLDALDQGRAEGTLADDGQFADAMARVADDSLARFYFNGPAAAPAFEETAGFDISKVTDLLPGGEIPWVSASVSVEDGGGRMDGAIGFAGDPEGFVGPSYEAALTDVAPAGALAYVSFKDLEGQLSKLRDAFAGMEPEIERDIGRFENELGVSLEEDIGPLLAGEGALYVRQGLFIPEVTLLLEVDDEANAMQVVDALVAGSREFVPLGEPQTVDIDGVEARQVDIEPPVSLFYAAFDGHLVVTTQRAGISALQEDGDRLSGDDRFEQALGDAGMPDETSGFAYVNLKDTIPYVLDLAGSGEDVPEEVDRNLEPLDHVVIYSTRDGNTVEFSGFLAIE
jgi:Protein of unknown function (DUF3352)